MEVGFKTDLGRSRVLNEYDLRIDTELGLFIVADAMGGHEAAELAIDLEVVKIAGWNLAPGGTAPQLGQSGLQPVGGATAYTLKRPT